MKGQKKKQAGITLIALVISIIVMSILAGVSLNATIGENGIVTQAQEAVLQQRIASQLEELNLELAKMNVDTITTDSEMAIQAIAQYLFDQGVIDSYVTTSSGQIAAGRDSSTGNKYFFGVKGDNTYKISRATDGLLSAELTTYTSGGDITGGYALVTADSFKNDASLPEEDKGKFTITDDAEVVFMDTITGELSIYVESGVHATVGVYADMTLTNQNISRSAIAIEPGGILDMYVGEGVTVTANSGFATQGATGSMGTMAQNTGGKGAFAGINVPVGATLNLKGSGTVVAYGGNATPGGAGTSSSVNQSSSGNGGGRRWRCWCWNWWKRW